MIAGPWELWRRDDHGNEFLVASFDSEDAARSALDRFEAKVHKQHYWIPDPAPAPAPAPDRSRS